MILTLSNVGAFNYEYYGSIFLCIIMVYDTPNGPMDLKMILVIIEASVVGLDSTNNLKLFNQRATFVFQSDFWKVIALEEVQPTYIKCVLNGQWFLLFCIMPFSTFALHMDSIVDCAQAHCVKKD